MQKKISVVIPTYNRPAHLIKCLQALTQQTLEFCCFEVIVVHDGPDDKSCLEEIKNLDFPFKFSVFSTDYKRGPAAARNLGWLTARNQLIAFTDDDCIPCKKWLTELLAVYHFQAYVAYSGKTIVPISDQPSDFEKNTAGLETADFITANSACTKQALIKVGGFDERFGMAWREDSDLEFKLIDNQIPIWRNSDAVVVHPVREASWGVSIKEQKKGIYDVLLFKKYPSLYRQKIQPRPLWNYYTIILTFCLTAIFAARGNNQIAGLTAILMLFPLGAFFHRRIKHTRRSILHITEMFFTSLLIPFFSVYWRGYGIIKFKKILL